MKSILLISTIYPLPVGNHGTSVCHFFAREWVKMGYNVKVVHIQSTFPHIFYWFARFNRKRIAAKTGAVVYTHRLSKPDYYIMDDVPVMRLPLLKLKPHGKYSQRVIRKAVETITKWNKKNDFTPDVIIGHFPNPQIEVLGILKDIYPNSKTCMVMHGDVEMIVRIYGERMPSVLAKIDMWGFRNKNVQRYFEKRIMKVERPFYCYSGIPAKYITEQNTHLFNTKLKNFVYVGELIERKYPSQILDALAIAYPDHNFHMDYVGEGNEHDTIEKKAKLLGITQQISLHGRIPRDKIADLYDHADCMVMISKWEAYGLVYLEAMARGCITIASRNEGFDGIIVNGVNGFLCKSGDSEELATIIQRINELSSEERQAISERAIETAKRLTDEKAAKLYIDNVIARMK